MKNFVVGANETNYHLKNVNIHRDFEPLVVADIRVIEDGDVCPKCGSQNLTKIERMNGYLSYSRVSGDTRLNDAKMAEIAERKSM